MLKYNDKDKEERLLKSINNIQQYPEWKIIREWIDASTYSLLILGSTVEDSTIRGWKQGGAQELLDLQSRFDNARKALDRMDKAKEQTPGIV